MQSNNYQAALVDRWKANLQSYLCGRQVVVSTCGVTNVTDAIKYDPTGLVWFSCLEMFFNYIGYPNYQVVKPEEGNCGGVVQMVYKEEADLGIDMTITTKRMELVDFSFPFITSGLVIVTRQPVAYTNSRYFISVYTSWVYLIFLVCLFATSFLIGRFETLFTGHTSKKTRKCCLLNYARILWRANNLFFPASAGGISMFPRPSIAILSITWLLALQIFVSVYNNFIYAKLAVPKKSKPIDNGWELLDLVKAGKMKWGTIGDSAYDSMFAESDQGVMKELWDAASPNWKEWNVALANAGYGKVMEDNYAFVDTSTNALATNTNRSGAFHISTSTFNMVLDTMATSKNGHFRKLCSPFIMKVLEAGFLQKWRVEVAMAMQKYQTYGQGGSSTKSLALKTTRNVFYILLSGLFLSIISFCFEILTRNKRITVIIDDVEPQPSESEPNQEA